MTEKPAAQPSWDQLSKALGFTRKTLQEWRKHPDAPTTRDPEDWQEFIEENGLGVAGNKAPASTTELRDEKLRKDIRLKELQIAEKERRSVDINEVDKLFFTVGTKQKAHLYAALLGELPAQLAGLDAGTIRNHLQTVADEVCDVMRTHFERWKGADAS